MTRDARESLTALAAVSFLVFAYCLVLFFVNDLRIPPWVNWVGAGVCLVALAVNIARRLRKPVGKPD